MAKGATRPEGSPPEGDNSTDYRFGFPLQGGRYAVGTCSCSERGHRFLGRGDGDHASADRTAREGEPPAVPVHAEADEVPGAEHRVCALLAGVVLIALAVLWRPLAFASADPEAAEARGVPVRALSLSFMLVLGLAVALCVQIVGALLVLSLLVTPAAAAARITASPVLLPVLSVVFALVSMEGGILLTLGGTVPISPYVTTLSFLIYLGCRLAASRRVARETGTVVPARARPAAGI